MKLELPTAFALVITGAVFTWAFYRLIYQGLSDILMSVGITGDAWQNIIIVVLAGVILMASGKKIGDMFK